VANSFMHLAAMDQGWRPQDFYPAEMVMTTENPWRRFKGLPEEVASKIELKQIKYHGKDGPSER